ncbi:Acetoin dehydrogenase E1 component beta-subunit [hydrothermal vent metagenome]|uniref:Acetoin dehydrogenase E1 component beta-subunit n=1 Tax=hydrothermal vent metagenome TaxID=652676 RepID=A0A3B1BBT4_9ZZZZ
MPVFLPIQPKKNYCMMSSHPDPQRILTVTDALKETFDQAMGADERVILLGLGVADSKGVFGTTLGLVEKYGATRVIDGPASENAITGIAIGTAILGMRPVLSHQRFDFSLMSMDQIINNAANWRYMFGGNTGVPITIRMIVGRGWGQGPQHSQNFQALLAHIPGLKVVAPTTAYEFKGLMLASIEDDDPVIFIEQRWLHNHTSHVPEEPYILPIGKAHLMKEGNDLTIVAAMDMAIEAMRAAKTLEAQNINVEVINLRTIKPFDKEKIISSVQKTGRLLVVDSGWRSFGIGAEIAAVVAEEAFGALRGAIRRIGLPDAPTPSSPGLTLHYYPTSITICETVGEMLFVSILTDDLKDDSVPHDIPDQRFSGPF